jgi:hypothetical protein
MESGPRIGATLIIVGALVAEGAAVYGCGDTAARPLALKGPPAGAIGDLCYPADEGDPAFSGFAQAVQVIEDQFPGCASGLCLVYHFQGRVDCPLGQPAPTPCLGPADTSCAGGVACVAADEVYLRCDPDAGAGACGGGACDPQQKRCTCTADAQCPAGTACDPTANRCAHFVCKPAGCQSAGASDADNAGKACCADGTGAPVSQAVCGQCAQGSPGAVENAVYCSCRCGPADGDPDAGGPFCACPDGMECTEIRPYLGPGFPNQYAGKYCIKAGTTYVTGGPDQCGQVQGYSDPSVCGG